MITRRDATAVLTSAAAILSLNKAFAASEGTTKARPLKAAKLDRPAANKSPLPFVPRGEARTFAADYDYIEEEWFASGNDDLGQPYTTQVVVRRPRDAKRFSGMLIVEPLHTAGIAAIYMYSSRYIFRSGHAWACVASQKSPLEEHVKRADANHYAALHIESGPMPAAEDPGQNTPEGARQRQGIVNQASNAILAQVGLALRNPGPMTGYNLRHVVLVGHSQTGGVVTNFINDAHETHRRAGGVPIFDGYFPAGTPDRQFGPRELPLVQVISEGDLLGGKRTGHRRPDSDDHKDRYRLYELAGAPHMGTRNPPNNNPGPWSQRSMGAVPPDAVMNSVPHNELFNMALEHFVRWIAHGETPPRADRIAMTGNTVAKDEHGNGRGGVRTAQLDVPRATYYPNPRSPSEAPTGWTTGVEVAFDKAKMRQLYGTPTAYVERFNRRLEELIRQHWFLGADATAMRDEALSQLF